VLFVALVALVAAENVDVHYPKTGGEQQVKASYFDLLVVTLEGVPTTGFHWKIDQIEDNVLAVNGTFITDVPPNNFAFIFRRIQHMYSTLYLSENSLNIFLYLSHFHNQPW